MLRPTIVLWPYFARTGIAVAVLGYFVVFGRWVGVVALASILLVCVIARCRWLWRFARQVRRFRTAEYGRITLHFSPELDTTWDIPIVLRQCQTEYERLARWFDVQWPFLFHRRIHVFLFSSADRISEIFGRRYGGTALASANAIVIGNEEQLEEPLRHELAHLFSSRWTQRTQPLFSEGLSVWLQSTLSGFPIDRLAWNMLCDDDLQLSRLLNPRFFFARPHVHRCYVLAGSFTGFLIRHYGKDKYRAIFSAATRSELHSLFTKSFGLSLEDAEQHWRRELRQTATER